jgi:hypothetical protein
MKTSKCALIIVLVICPLLLGATPVSSMSDTVRKEPPFYYVLLLTTNVKTAPILFGSGLYRLNSVVTFRAPPALIGLGGAVVHFSHWTGDYAGNSTMGQVTITADMFLMAVYN